ncbi:PLP-dependent aminotransferase family protein [Rhodobacteraceae bacterium RKSG542]|uniref:MocR-like ectoine utilization transcription factor EhuR n=1 Tax=Pseudovibrio flavus TaxID=2529854 RepID=UPI0012BBC022|nr:PLP-dependent aminotransferase family protein [Pseudovibrio flavus]MTI17503.1 PLP-dependent aminotransferase family protein [Pseudovibrio flavus]
MTMWQPERDQLTRPVYKSLQKLIIKAIESGSLLPGERLPTHRDLAFSLDISVQTVTRAYEALRDLGYLSGEVGRGTFVRSTPADMSMPFLPMRDHELIDLSMLKPVTDSLHHVALQEALQDLSGQLTPNLLQSFRPEAVFKQQTHVACNWLQDKGIPARPSEFLFTNGATSAVATALMTATPPACALCVEEVSFHSVKPLAGYLGVRLSIAEMDEQGLTPRGFEQSCIRDKVRAVLLSPSVANPKSLVMGLERRLEILEIARKYDVFIIENDIMGATVRGVPPTFKALDPAQVFYITAFSKQIIPGMRIGILLSPMSAAVAAANRHLVTSWMANPLMVDILSRWMENGKADELINWQTNALERRHSIAKEALVNVTYTGHPNSTHIWVPLPSGVEEAELINQARRSNIAVAGSLPFVMAEEYSTGAPGRHNAIRVAVGSVDERRLEYALGILANLILSDAEKPLPIF